MEGIKFNKCIIINYLLRMQDIAIRVRRKEIRRSRGNDSRHFDGGATSFYV